MVDLSLERPFRVLPLLGFIGDDLLKEVNALGHLGQLDGLLLALAVQLRDLRVLVRQQRTQVADLLAHLAEAKLLLALLMDLLAHKHKTGAGALPDLVKY